MKQNTIQKKPPILTINGFNKYYLKIRLNQ